MGNYKIVITESDYEDDLVEKEILEPIGCEIVRLNSREETILKKALQDADGVLFQWAHLTEPVIHAMSRCRVLAKYATGIDGVDLSAATEKNICVTNVPDYCTEEVSDHTCAMLLSLARGIKLHDSNIRRGIYDYHAAKALPDLRRGILGIVGFGRISRSVIQKMKPFCGEIWVCSRASTEEILAVAGLKKTFDEVIKNADYLSIHVPGNKETYHQFNKTVFLNMKPGACLVNVARGSVICEEDLVEALRTGQVGFAALDVFEVEPLPQSSPLKRLENVVLSPHAGWYSCSSQRLLQRKAAEQVRAVLEGRRPEYLVNQEVAKHVFHPK